MNIYKAAETDDLDELNKLLASGVDINARLRTLTPLMCAVAEGANDAVTTLLQHGADVNLQAKVGTTALMFASMHGYDDFVSLLLDHSAQIDIQDNKGWTALHHAVQGNSGQIIALLASRGANLKLKTKKRQTVLDIAIECKHIEAADILLAQGGKFEETAASESRPAKRLELWLTETVPLFSSAASGDTHRMEQLLNAGVAPDLLGEHNRTALLTAIDKGQEAAVLMLIEHGANVNAATPNGWPPLVSAIMMRRTSIAKILLFHGADATVKTIRGYSALQMAAEHGDDHLVGFLLTHAEHLGQQLDIEDAIKAAEEHEHDETARFLKAMRAF